MAKVVSQSFFPSIECHFKGQSNSDTSRAVISSKTLHSTHSQPSPFTYPTLRATFHNKGEPLDQSHSSRLSFHSFFPTSPFNIDDPQAMKMTKKMKKKMRTPNTLTMSHRLEVTLWKYLRISPCPASTFIAASSTLESMRTWKERHHY